MHGALFTQFCTNVSVAKQGNSIDVYFNGLLAEFPVNLDSFFTSTTSDYMGWLVEGGG